jgi:hypothetical protein
VEHLKREGKMSWMETYKGFNKVLDLLGRNRLARDIEPDDIKTNTIARKRLLTGPRPKMANLMPFPCPPWRANSWIRSGLPPERC